MRKFFTLAIACVMSMAAVAQTVSLKRELGLKHIGMNGAAASVVAAESEDLWGYYLGDAASLGGLGTEAAGTFRVAVFVPGTGALSGAKISAVNLPVMATRSTSVSVWGGATLGSKTAFNKSVESVTAGYNKIELDEPVSIPASGLYVGYTFTIASATTQAEKYPIATAEGYAAGSLYLALSATGAMDDYSGAGYGMSGLQVYVTGMNLPENGVSITAVQAEAAAMGSKSAFLIGLSSDSKNAVSSIGYTLTVDGVQTSGTKTLTPAIPAGLMKTGVAEIEFDAPSSVGSFAASVAITTVNGVANDVEATPFNFTVNTVTRVVPRVTVIEEFTGTGCGYCPRGWVGMEAVKEQREDKAVVIAWHKYNSADPMYVANYASLSFDGAPQCCVDRKTYPDPYYGESEESILTCVDNYNTSVPTVDIAAEARFSEDNKNVTVKSNTEFLTNVSGYTIAYVITADSLCGSTSAWKQSNYYYQYTAAQAGILSELPDLQKFCKNGTWGKSSVGLVFNDALIASTYTAAGKSQVAAFTADQQVAGVKAASEYTLTMPTKTTLVNALKYDKIYATVLVIDNNGMIANAKRVRVLGAHETEDGEGGNTATNQVISPISEECQLMGENASYSMNFVVGTNYATFAPAMWNVATGEVANYADFEEGSFHAANTAGWAVGSKGGSNDYALCINPEGTEVDLYYNVGEEIETDWGTMSTGDAGSSAWAISEDASIIAGCYFDASWLTKPCVWTAQGERFDLPLPTSEEIGFEISGGQARWMSADGSVLLGFVNDNMSTWPAILWCKNAEGQYEYKMICKDFFEDDYQKGKPYMVFTPSGISADGKVVALTVQGEYDFFDFETPVPAEQAARLTLETMQLEVLDMGEGMSVATSGIANDGTMLLYTGGNDMIGRSGYIWAAGHTAAVSLDEMMGAVEEIPAMLTNTPCAISADGKKVQGFAMAADEEANIFSYVIEVNISETEIINQVAPIESVQIFNLQGVRVNDTKAHGIYVVGGKKIMK